MASTGKHVVFDIVGTCVSYDALLGAVEERIGEKLKAHGILPRLFTFSWTETAEREYTYLGMSGRYVRFWDAFKPLFYRILHASGVENPKAFITESDLDYIIASSSRLTARPGAHECFQKLRDAGFTVWALTAGDPANVQSNFKVNNLVLPDENFMSCDEFQVVKPDPKIYKSVLERFAGAEQTWFAAAHMWDTSAAKRSGFKGAWCAVLEGEYLPELFGEVDVVADTLPAMADKIIAASEN